MALLTIPAGNNLLAWTAPETALSTQAWFAAASVARIYRKSANGLGYVFVKPGDPLPAFTTLAPAASGQPLNVYIVVVKQAFTVDAALVGLQGSLSDGALTALLNVPTATDVQLQIEQTVNALDPAKLEAPKALVRSLDQLRGQMPADLGAVYKVVDKAKGINNEFMYDPSDTTSPDDGGMTVVSSNGLRFTSVTQDYLRVRNFGMVANDRSMMAHNAQVWANIRRLGNDTDIVWDGSGQYFVGHSQTNRGFADSPYCLELVDFVGSLRQSRSCQIVTETGYTGLQFHRTTGECRPRLIDLNLAHDGGRDAVPDYLRTRDANGNYVPIGQANSYDRNWGNWKKNGINAWGQCHATGTQVYGYPGHDVCVFGATTSRFDGPSFYLPGVYGEFNGDLTFTPDDAGAISRLGIQPGWLFTEGSFSHGVGGTLNGFMTLGYAGARPAGTRATAELHQAGKTLLADSQVWDGPNSFQSAGALGMFFTGDEANQNSVYNLRVGNARAHSIVDQSLLKQTFIDPHLTASGEGFGGLAPFTNNGDPNASTRIFGLYEEGGNQPVSDYGGGLVLGGVPGNGRGLNGYGLLNGELFGAYTQANGRVIRLKGDSFLFDLPGVGSVTMQLDGLGRLCLNGRPVATTS